MRAIMAGTSVQHSAKASGRGPGGARLDAVVRIATALLLLVWMALPWIAQAVTPPDEREAVGAASGPGGGDATAVNREILLAGYIAQPYYYRSDVHLKQAGGTDAVLKRMGWDGDAIHPPIDGGVRSVQWWHNVGFMVDFLHNKAIARLGKGAHGRKASRPIIEEVAVEGTMDGKPAPSRLRLPDRFERFEFTHGHNVLLFTPLLRMGTFTPRVRPYLGVGGGFALPHVELWSTQDRREDRTSEYQLAGSAWQVLAGVELRTGKLSYFLEYKFTFAFISAALTGDQSWKNFNMPGDLLRQFGRWWRGEAPRLGAFTTRLGAHQIAVGAGYWWQR